MKRSPSCQGKGGLDVERILFLGSEIDTMTDQELQEVVETTTVLPNYHQIKSADHPLPQE